MSVDECLSANYMPGITTGCTRYVSDCQNSYSGIGGQPFPPSDEDHSTADNACNSCVSGSSSLITGSGYSYSGVCGTSNPYSQQSNNSANSAGEQAMINASIVGGSNAVNTSESFIFGSKKSSSTMIIIVVLILLGIAGFFVYKYVGKSHQPLKMGCGMNFSSRPPLKMGCGMNF